jgi:tRNA (guanosine-2'-O-)-methyltransferase
MPILDPELVPDRPTDPRLTPAHLTQWLRPHLSARRIERIERVVSHRLASVTVVLEKPYDPHNGAAVLRSCEAFGLLHVHVISGPGGFSFSRKVTQSAHKWLNVYLHRSTQSCLRMLSDWGYERWAAAPPKLGSRAPSARVSQNRPVALVLGNEHAGLSAEALASCDRRFHLPIHGFSESFNLSVSAALAVGEVSARRRVYLGSDGDLPDKAREQLRAAYYVSSVRRADAVVLRALRSFVG